MLIVNPRYGLTYDEIAEVVVARVTQLQTMAVICGCCGTAKMVVSRDSGITAKWFAAANVMDRLRRGELIDGRV